MVIITTPSVKNNSSIIDVKSDIPETAMQIDEWKDTLGLFCEKLNDILIHPFDRDRLKRRFLQMIFSIYFRMFVFIIGLLLCILLGVSTPYTLDPSVLSYGLIFQGMCCLITAMFYFYSSLCHCTTKQLEAMSESKRRFIEETMWWPHLLKISLWICSFIWFASDLYLIKTSESQDFESMILMKILLAMFLYIAAIWDILCWVLASVIFMKDEEVLEKYLRV